MTESVRVKSAQYFVHLYAKRQFRIVCFSEFLPIRVTLLATFCLWLALVGRCYGHRTKRSVLKRCGYIHRAIANHHIIVTLLGRSGANPAVERQLHLSNHTVTEPVRPKFIRSHR